MKIYFAEIGLFECVQSSSPNDEIQSENNFAPIIERMESDYRPQMFYIDSPLRAFTLEMNSKNEWNRVWHDLDANQLMTIEELTYVEYTPTENDQLTAADYGYFWWFCLAKRILKRNEYVMKCVLAKKEIYYIPCSSIDEICLYPVGQRGSTNMHKYQTISNLVEQFSLPIHVKLAQLPGLSDAYENFSGHVQILGSYTKEFAVCATLSSTNVSLISLKTPVKFTVSLSEITDELTRCEVFLQAFDKRIRRIILSDQSQNSHRSRSKSKRSEFRRAQSHDDRAVQRKNPSKKQHASQFSIPFTYETGSNLTEEMNSIDANGSILFDDQIEFFSLLNR